MVVTTPNQTPKVKRCFLIDGPIYFFRAWFALPQDISHPNGTIMSGAYGFARFLIELLGKHKPSHVVIAFDESLHRGFRNDIFEAYKHSRVAADECVSFQLKLCQQIAQQLGVTVLVSQRYEADDLLAGAANISCAAGFANTVISRDKDLVQIVQNPSDEWWAYPAEAPKREQALTEMWGVAPHQIGDFLALAGDSSDDIPGVAGVGAKTAANLLNQWHTIDGILANIDAVETSGMRSAKRIAANIKAGEQQLRISQQLSRLYPESAQLNSINELYWQGPQATAAAFFENNGLQRYSSWLARLEQVYGQA